MESEYGSESTLTEISIDNDSDEGSIELSTSAPIMLSRNMNGLNNNGSIQYMSNLSGQVSEIFASVQRNLPAIADFDSGSEDEADDDIEVFTRRDGWSSISADEEVRLQNLKLSSSSIVTSNFSGGLAGAVIETVSTETTDNTTKTAERTGISISSRSQQRYDLSEAEMLLKALEEQYRNHGNSETGDDFDAVFKDTMDRIKVEQQDDVPCICEESDYMKIPINKKEFPVTNSKETRKSREHYRVSRSAIKYKEYLPTVIPSLSTSLPGGMNLDTLLAAAEAELGPVEVSDDVENFFASFIGVSTSISKATYSSKNTLTAVNSAKIEADLPPAVSEPSIPKICLDKDSPLALMEAALSGRDDNDTLFKALFAGTQHFSNGTPEYNSSDSSKPPLRPADPKGILKNKDYRTKNCHIDGAGSKASSPGENTPTVVIDLRDHSSKSNKINGTSLVVIPEKGGMSSDSDSDDLAFFHEQRAKAFKNSKRVKISEANEPEIPKTTKNVATNSTSTNHDEEILATLSAGTNCNLLPATKSIGVNTSPGSGGYVVSRPYDFDSSDTLVHNNFIKRDTPAIFEEDVSQENNEEGEEENVRTLLRSEEGINEEREVEDEKNVDTNQSLISNRDIRTLNISLDPTNPKVVENQHIDEKEERAVRLRTKQARDEERKRRILVQETAEKHIRSISSKSEIIFHSDITFDAPLDTLRRTRGHRMLTLSIQLAGLQPPLVAQLIAWLLTCLPSTTSSEKPTIIKVSSTNGHVSPLLTSGRKVQRETPFYVIGLAQSTDSEKASSRVLYVAVQATENSVGRKGSSGTFKRKLNNFFTDSTVEGAFALSAYRSGYTVKEASSRTPLRSIVSVIEDNPLSLPPLYHWWCLSDIGSANSNTVSTSTIEENVETTVSVIPYSMFCANPLAVVAVLERIYAECMDLVGLRLCFRPSTEGRYSINSSSGMMTTSDSDADDDERRRTRLASLRAADVNWAAYTDVHKTSSTSPPSAILALAIRGPDAISMWDTAVGPIDPIIARTTDPNSLRALHGVDREVNLLSCSRSVPKVKEELTYWFGPRIASTVNWEASVRPQKIRSSLPLLIVPSVIAAWMFASPLVPVAATGVLIREIQRRGFRLIGVTRTRLDRRRAVELGLPSCFSESTTQALLTEVNNSSTFVPMCLALLLQREDAAVHVVALAQLLHSEIMAAKFINPLSIDCRSYFRSVPAARVTKRSLGLSSSVPDRYQVEAHLSRYARRYPIYRPMSFGYLSSLPGDIERTPAGKGLSELEYIILVSFIGVEAISTSGPLLSSALKSSEVSNVEVSNVGGFELLGLKHISGLQQYQAKELTPLEVGETGWRDSVDRIAREPALLVVLRRVDAFSQARKQFATDTPGKSKSTSGSVLISSSPEVATRQVHVFFREEELSSDPSFIKERETFNPPLVGGGILNGLLEGPMPCTTIAIIKPAQLAVSEHIHRILKKIYQEGFELVGLRMHLLRQSEAELISQADNDKGIESKYLRSGPVLLLCLERANAVRRWLDVAGPKDPYEARKSDPFSVRGSFGKNDLLHNVVHASESYSTHLRERKVFFPSGLCRVSPCPVHPQPSDQLPPYYCLMCSAYDSIVGDMSTRTLMLPQSATLSQAMCLVLDHTIVGGHIHRDEVNFNDNDSHTTIRMDEVLNELVLAKFSIIGMRMVPLTPRQSQRLVKSRRLSDVSHLSDLEIEMEQATSDELARGGCVAIAIQRDNALFQFQMLINKTGSSLGRCGRHIIWSAHSSQAAIDIAFFFDELLDAKESRVLLKDRESIC